MILSLEPITHQSCFWNRVGLLAKEAFPLEEYLAPEELVRIAQSDNFDFWALTDQDQFVGFMVVMTHQTLSYLFFLAIEPVLRSRVYGNGALEALRQQYPAYTQVVDFEMLNPHAANCRQREKRRAFYARNRYRETGLFLRYLGVDYKVFCQGAVFDPALFKAMMATLRIDGFKPIYFPPIIRLSLNANASSKRRF